jgi:hypothetical protein
MESPTIETFAAVLETTFRVRNGPGDAPIPLRLVDVRPLGRQPHAPRVEPFALEFAGPLEPRLEQRIYQLEHQTLGLFEIFLVPIGFDPAGGLRYEAVFN